MIKLMTQFRIDWLLTYLLIKFDIHRPRYASMFIWRTLVLWLPSAVEALISNEEIQINTTKHLVIR